MGFKALGDLERSLRYRVQLMKLEKSLLWIDFPLFAPNSAGTPSQRSKFTYDSISNLVPQLILVADDFSNLGIQGNRNRLLSEVENPKAAKLLGELFDSYGSDKCTPHNYHNFYSSLFDDPEEVKNVFEIGLGTPNLNVISNMGVNGKPGSSLRAFRDFFTSAKIYGADVDKEVLFEEDGISTFWVDQTNIESLKEVFSKLTHKLDLVIDDGLHSPQANLNTLVSALPHVEVGGWFIVEDVASESIPLWQLICRILSPEIYKTELILGKSAHLFAVQRLK